MTTEEKAKAYDEALERAKAYHRNELSGSRKEITEYIFPELRESEDERIRKEMIKYFTEIKSTVPIGSPNHFDSYLAYLERQKEQKHAPDDLQKSFEAGQMSIVDNPEQYGLCKKTEWSEVDKMVLNSAIFWLERTLTVEKAIDISTRDCPLSMNETLDKLKSLHPQAKRYWSEEDEKMLESIVNLVAGADSQPLGLRFKQFSWLKSRCP